MTALDYALQDLGRFLWTNRARLRAIVTEAEHEDPSAGPLYAVALTLAFVHDREEAESGRTHFGYKIAEMFAAVQEELEADFREELAELDDPEAPW
jgi:hypothetical protein